MHVCLCVCVCTCSVCVCACVCVCVVEVLSLEEWLVWRLETLAYPTVNCIFMYLMLSALLYRQLSELLNIHREIASK